MITSIRSLFPGIQFNNQSNELVPELVILKADIGEEFAIGSKICKIISIGKYSGKLNHIKYTLKVEIGKLIKKLFVWCINGQYRLHGISGGENRDWLNNVLRDIEGCLIIDLINADNPFHNNSKLYEIYIR